MDRIGWRRIVKELGRGAMGVVYHAIDPHIGRPAAIRTIQPGTLRKPEEQDDRANAPFARRARPVFAIPASSRFTTSNGRGDLAYIAMEYADGPPPGRNTQDRCCPNAASAAAPGAALLL
jgi:serine/threonine protein kinase